MTLFNANKIGFQKSKKIHFSEKFTIFLFSLLPISLMLGNTVINSNILIIDIFFLFTCYRQKKWSWIKDKYFYLFLTIWIYLIFNSVYSTSDITNTFDFIKYETVFPQKESLIRSVGFIRFVIFVFAVQYFFVNSKKTFNKIFFCWFIIIVVVSIDVIFERILGFNLLGFKSPSPHRIVSFFKDELIVGSFLLGFSFLITGFLVKSTNNNLIKKIILNIFLILPIICIYFSGERSNFVKASIITFIILFIINDTYLYIKKKYIFLLIIIGILISAVTIESVYDRQSNFFKRIQKYDYDSAYKNFGHIRHFVHYDTAWQIFRDYPVFGIGNSKFRYVCHQKKYFNAEMILSAQRCSNHPHQVHLELLSEQGLVGYLIIIFTIFYVLLNSFKAYRKTNDAIHLSSILFVLTFFIPLLPSGSFFSTFNASIFWINFSFVHAFLIEPEK